MPLNPASQLVLTHLHAAKDSLGNLLVSAEYTVLTPGGGIEHAVQTVPLDSTQVATVQGWMNGVAQQFAAILGITVYVPPTAV